MKTPQLIDWMCFLTLTTRLTAKTQRGPRSGEKQRGYFRAPDADDAVVGTDNFASLVPRPSKLATCRVATDRRFSFTSKRSIAKKRKLPI
jgi:hypothetical protein